MGEACWFAEPGPEQWASGLTHIRSCWMLCGMETDRCHLYPLSPPCFPGRGIRRGDHLFILPVETPEQYLLGAALTRVCCPDFCGCHQRHLSVASLWWPVGRSLAGPAELEPAEKGLFKLSAPQGTARGSRQELGLFVKESYWLVLRLLI